MPEEKPAAGIKSTVSGWLKAGLASVVSLISGAALMYLTPLVNSAIKPAKPVANFATEVTGLNLQINNRTTGGAQGWWDFGDGSALEPYDPKAEIVKHVYAKPGKYDIKLAVQNVLNEESTRSASVTLDAPTPEVAVFKLEPITADERAPATYRLQAKVKNASYAILAVDDQPLEFIDDAASQDRYITFKEMGAYTVRMAAVSGKQIVEKSTQVYVSGNDRTGPMAVLHVSYEAVKVERGGRIERIACTWPGDATTNVVSFRKERPAFGGKTYLSAELVNKDDKSGVMQNAKLEIGPDKKQLILTGEMKRPTGPLSSGGAPAWTAEVRVVTERRSQPQTIKPGSIMMALDFNTPIKLPMQPVEEGWEILRKNVKIEILDGDRKVWEGAPGITGAKMTWKNQTCLLSAMPLSDGVVLKLDTTGTAPTLPPVTPAKHVPKVTPVTLPTPAPRPGPIVRPTGFERNPLLPAWPMKK